VGGWLIPSLPAAVVFDAAVKAPAAVPWKACMVLGGQPSLPAHAQRDYQWLGWGRNAWCLQLCLLCIALPAFPSPQVCNSWVHVVDEVLQPASGLR
jgi:hypothetical protein